MLLYLIRQLGISGMTSRGHSCVDDWLRVGKNPQSRELSSLLSSGFSTPETASQIDIPKLPDASFDTFISALLLVVCFVRSWGSEGLSCTVRAFPC